MRYVVTGGSGHIGAAVAKHLASRSDSERVVVADVHPPRSRSEGVDVAQIDVRDAGQLGSVLQRWHADTLVHIATALEKTNGNGAASEDSVVATTSALSAATAAQTRHVLVVSSGVTYEVGAEGSHATEASSLRSTLDSDYARASATVDRLAQLWAARQPDRVMTIVRPCTVMGQGVDDAITRLFTDPPFRARFANPETAIQFVHEDDFVTALVLLASGAHGGAFNVAGDGTVSVGDCLELLGLKGRRGPGALYSKLRPRPASGAGLELLCGMPALATGRIREMTDWRPRHTSRSAFEAAMGARGRLADPVRRSAQ
jgi:UDP-glucose 4-epimerase